ncbi:hypothetical protein [Klebsiella pneumoniae]|uniref:hypothetical protein n=1 Tax=Klebsiella pneumoniae TaxID=573 RepID=UPI001C04CECF|nr:hypothetical protein [Klebsiella pneumoniae]MBU0049588.1 hypothetical protein [Klebsiella pneumoniae]
MAKNENDYQGLLAYACYKMEKDKLAQDLREANKSEDEVERDLEQNVTLPSLKPLSIIPSPVKK